MVLSLQLQLSLQFSCFRGDYFRFLRIFNSKELLVKKYLFLIIQEKKNKDKDTEKEKKRKRRKTETATDDSDDEEKEDFQIFLVEEKLVIAHRPNYQSSSSTTGTLYPALVSTL